MVRPPTTITLGIESERERDREKESEKWRNTLDDTLKG
jgi:hypothetical protein